MDAKVTDTAGRDWHITITLENARAIKRDLGVDIFDIEAGSGFIELASDPDAVGDLFAYLVNDQKLRRGITDKELAKSLTGKYAEIVGAIQAAYLNFSPAPRQGLVKRLLSVLTIDPQFIGGEPSQLQNQPSDSDAITSVAVNSSRRQKKLIKTDGDTQPQLPLP